MQEPRKSVSKQQSRRYLEDRSPEGGQTHGPFEVLLLAFPFCLQRCWQEVGGLRWDFDCISAERVWYKELSPWDQ